MAREWAGVPAYEASLERVLGRERAGEFMREIGERSEEMRALRRHAHSSAGSDPRRRPTR